MVALIMPCYVMFCRFVQHSLSPVRVWRCWSRSMGHAAVLVEKPGLQFCVEIEKWSGCPDVLGKFIRVFGRMSYFCG